jgi:hypothetical protein
MKQYEKKMIILILILLVGLSVKSLFLDEVRPDSIELEQYQRYAKLAASLMESPFSRQTGMFTYRTVSVTRVSDEGETAVIYLDEGDAGDVLVEVTIPGQYEARVRGYLLSILPVKQVRIEGGLTEDGGKTED